MDGLNIDTFIRAADDPELSQYRVLAFLKKYTDELHKNKLYPAFADLIELGNELHFLLDQLSFFDENYVMNMEELDENLETIDFGKDLFNRNDLDVVFKFINWAMPAIDEAIDEGIAIYDFVTENIKIKEVGVIPLYRNEGYYFIPDNITNVVHVYHFDMTLFSTSSSPLRTLKTTLIDVINKEELSKKSLEDVKLELIERFPELPTPAVYSIETDLEFPFIETVLPVAKRKLVRYLSS